MTLAETGRTRGLSSQRVRQVLHGLLGGLREKYALECPARQPLQQRPFRVIYRARRRRHTTARPPKASSDSVAGSGTLM